MAFLFIQYLFDIESCKDFSNKDFDKCRTVHSKTAGVFFPLFFVSIENVDPFFNDKSQVRGPRGLLGLNTF